ncbi:protein of unknown function (plasmid) [Thermococcus nautili]|nr:protein of unknown function [Thermococcus nautili]
MSGFKWKKIRTFDEFLDEFERYVNEYFTKNVILTNRVNLKELDGGDVLFFEVSTPSIDIILKIFVPDRVIMDSYFTDGWAGGPNRIYDDWNGLILTEEQFSRFLGLARKMVDYYNQNKGEFQKARSEAFMNLIVGTKGKVIDALEEALGEETATLLIAKELGVLKED